MDLQCSGLSATVHPWLKLVRLQFLPMSIVVYATGVLSGRCHGIDALVFLGLIFGLSIQVASVLASEYVDAETDALNGRMGMFNGGSGVLVQGRIGKQSVLLALYTLLVVSALSACLLIAVQADERRLLTSGLVLAAYVFGMGYSFRPLRLSYNGLGELAVALMYGPFVLFFSYSLHNSGVPVRHVLAALGMFFAIFQGKILAGIPDMESDRQSGRRTIPVLIGTEHAYHASLVSALLAYVFFAMFVSASARGSLAGMAVALAGVHAGALCVLVSRMRLRGGIPGNRTLMLSIAYIAWYGLFPLVFACR